MTKFKRNLNTSEDIPTASLPDIIFMLLFFFMVTTIIRPHEIMVQQHVPKATQLKKIEQKSLVTHFNIGAPKNKVQYGTESRIQFNDVFIEPEQIPQQIEQARQKLGEAERDKLTVSLKIDQEVKMGIVTDVEEQFKEVNALKVLYNTVKDEEAVII